MSPKLYFVFRIRTSANVLKHIDSDVKIRIGSNLFEIKYFSASSEDISSTCEIKILASGIHDKFPTCRQTLDLHKCGQENRFPISY